MRLLRAWLPALLAAALWLVSGVIEWRSRAAPGFLLRVLDLLAPETVPVGQLLAPAPWPAVLAGLSALAVAGAHAATLALVRARRREAPVLTTLAAYWMCAVVAGAVTAAIPFVAAVVGALVEGRMPSGLAGTYLVTGAHWGLLWGWLPALLARALDTDDAAVRSRAGLVAAGALVLVAAGVATAVASPMADAARQAAIPAAPEPEPVPTGTPVPEVAPGEWQVDPLWCTSGQLEFTAGPVDAALGVRAMPVHATNVADAACVLEGYPDIALGATRTGAVDVEVDFGGDTVVEDPGLRRIELAPGERAVTVLGWRAPAASSAEPADWLHVAGYHGGRREMVEVDTDITGGTVSVTAWELAAD
ncbi:DUF4232 domain-containing protein [Georgenia satyanarayanai]|uniref:DUF4232 domain-containing protein n=1 Tax=Georgenia satyanarayanai TaxID=860221 RepID=UPI00203E409B|nr:DUF4232 domain-containing protein [Georgenia satyanarayanai]MCM3661361.1 DUF4232 domain-containing protein [Georgenia satyanarayanai]